MRPALRIALALAGSAALGLFGHVCAIRGNDFVTFREVGVAALQRADIYAPTPTTGMYVFYAPYFALAMMPWGLIPAYPAAWSWFLLKVGSLGLLGRRLRRELIAPGYLPWSTTLAAVLPFALCLNPVNGDFRLGQVNVFVFLLTFATLRALQAGRPGLASVAFSLALIKVTPWVFLPWLALRRQWRFLAWLGAVGAGWLVALAAWFGPAQLPGLFLSWVEASRAQKLGLEGLAYFENQSLPGIAARLATTLPALQRPVLGFPVHQWIWMVLTTGMFLFLALLVRRDRERPGQLPDGEFALVCLIMLLCSPDTRWAHMSQLLGPAFLLSRLALRLELLGPRKGGASVVAAGPRWLVSRAALAAVLVAGIASLILLTRDVVGKPLDQALRAGGLQAAFLVLLFLFVAALLVKAPDLLRGGEVPEASIARGEAAPPDGLPPRG